MKRALAQQNRRISERIATTNDARSHPPQCRRAGHFVRTRTRETAADRARSRRSRIATDRSRSDNARNVSQRQIKNIGDSANDYGQ
jgi:hypothetical protein